MIRFFVAAVLMLTISGSRAEPLSSPIRIGVFPSFQYNKDAAGQPRGLALGIARALAARLGVADIVTIEHPTPPLVIACVKAGACDFGFMLIDPARATEVDFTPPFVRSDFTYLLPAASSIRNAPEVDRLGVRVAVVRDHASTLAWVRRAKEATPVYVESYEAAVDVLSNGKADAFASIRELLIKYSSELPGSRVLADSYQTNLAGVAVAKGKPDRLAAMSETLAELKRTGVLAQIIQDASLHGVEVVP